MKPKGRFFVQSAEGGELSLSAGVARLLFSDGIIDQMRSDAGLTSEIDEYETDELPASCLDALAASSRRAAVEYETGPLIRRLTWQSWSPAGTAEHHVDVKCSEVYEFLVRLAELAELAARLHLPLHVEL
jgi:hypothetical protein